MAKLNVAERLRQYLYLTRLHRPIGVFILLWPALWALWLAGNGHPSWMNVIIFCAGVILMRSAGCVINDFADRDFDPHVERTRFRPMATGQVSPQEALILFVVLCLIAFALVLQLNGMTIALSFVAAFLAGSYPFMKRFTHWPQAYLGLAFGFAVPMAFAAETETIPAVAWLLYLAVMLWALVYDTMYAMVDKDDDLKIGVKSTAILFGDYDKQIMGGLQLLILLILIAVGYWQQLGGYYDLGLAVAAGLSVYQQYLIKDRDKTRCFQAFLNNNYFGLAVFAGIVLDFGWV